MTVQMTRRSAVAELMRKTLSQEITRDLPLAWWHGNNFTDGLSGATFADFTANTIDLRLWNDGALGAGYPAKTGRLTVDPGDTWAQQMHPGSNFRDVSAWPQLNFAGNFTLECWIKPTAADLSDATWRDLIVKGTPGGGENNVEYALRIVKTGATYALRAYVTRSDGVQTATTGAGQPLLAGQLHHVCLAYETTGTLLAVIDGLSTPSFFSPRPPVPGAGAFVLGQFDQAANGFAGVLDEICVYDKVLPAARISAHYHAGIGS